MRSQILRLRDVIVLVEMRAGVRTNNFSVLQTAPMGRDSTHLAHRWRGAAPTCRPRGTPRTPCPRRLPPRGGTLSETAAAGTAACRWMTPWCRGWRGRHTAPGGPAPSGSSRPPSCSSAAGTALEIIFCLSAFTLGYKKMYGAAATVRVYDRACRSSWKIKSYTHGKTITTNSFVHW